MNTASSANAAAQSIDRKNRKPLRLQSVAGTSQLPPRTKSNQTQIWFDMNKANSDALPAILQRLPNLQYTGVVMGPVHLALLSSIPPSLRLIYAAANAGEIDALQTALQSREHACTHATVLSDDADVLARAQQMGFDECLRQYVDDEASLHRSIHLGKKYAHLMIHFRDPTNIPLELVIASLQPTNTTLLKEIADPANVEDAVVSLGVMEVGADGVVFSPSAHEVLDAFAKALQQRRQANIALEPATVV